MKKKIIAITLCALIALGMIAGIANAVEVIPEENISLCFLPPEEVSD